MRTRIGFYIIAFVLALVATSCVSTELSSAHFRALARAGIRLGIDIEANDNHRLYLEASRWLHTPYRAGGHTLRGTDCSGFVSHMYRKVYGVKLQRSAEGQLRHDCRRIPARSIREGDLVFFHNGRKRKTASHVGIYLKDRRFVHAATRGGVIVSSLDEPYYRKHFLTAGRPRIHLHE